ncbi:MAG: ABC transporter ATP-binding protein [Propionibacteriaceae bacterium]
MSQNMNESAPVDQLEAWRGVGAEGSKKVITQQASVFLKGRSKQLLGSLIKPCVWFLPVLVAAIVLENAARLAMPKLVQRGLDDAVPTIMRGGTTHGLWLVMGAMIAVIAIQTVTRIFFLRVSGRIGQQIMLELRQRVFRKFQRLDVAFHDRYTSGRVISRLTNDIDAIQELVSSGLDSIITALLTLVGVGALLVWTDVTLGLICLVSFPVLLMLLRWFSINSSTTYRKVREMASLVIVHFTETMSGMKAVQAYRREPRNQDIFLDAATRYEDINVTSFRLMAIFMPAVRLTGNITIGITLIVGGLMTMDGQMTVGALAAFLLYLRMFFEPMGEISQFYNTFQSAISALEKLSGVLEEPEVLAEPNEPTPLPNAQGAIGFENVSFAYVEGHPVLPGLELQIPAGQTVALVGTTGAGKTTIAKLMARFYDPVTGVIRLDGIDLRELSSSDLRRAVTLVTQENFMFDGSVADNIAFGKPGASRDEIVAAARAVGAATFIEAMPESYDTDLGKRGSRISAGQKQLIAFARAFLADPAVLILDEATSSLDVPSERLVQNALQTILKDRTAVIIAHRLSTVEIADRVLVLEHGQIVEDGSPAGLIAQRDGHYAALHQAWIDSLA